jgi:O-antigen/teichoic acid export membrane protein
MIIGNALRLASGVLTLPLAIRTIPQAEMGLYYTFLSIAGVVVLLDFGFAPAIVRNAGFAMGGARAFTARGLPVLENSEPNLPLLRRLVGAVAVYYSWASVGLAVLLGGAGSIFILGRLHADGIYPSLLAAWLLFATGQVMLFNASYWGNVLIGIGEVRAFAVVSIIAQSLALVLVLGGLLGGLSVYAYGISAVATALVTRFVSRALFRRVTSDSQGLLLKKEKGATVQIIRTMWPMAWRQGIVAVGAFLIQRGNTLICSAKLGLEDTAQYGLSVALVTIIFQVATVPVVVALPTIARLRVSRDYYGIWWVFAPRLYLGLAVGVVGVAGLAYFGEAVFTLVGAQTKLLSPALIVLLGLVWGLETHHSYYAGLVLTENENPFLLPALVSGLCIVAASWWAVGFAGVTGLILAQGGVQLLWNNWWTVRRGVLGLRASVPH